jgi:hypothetical protein
MRFFHSAQSQLCYSISVRQPLSFTVGLQNGRSCRSAFHLIDSQ